MDLEIFVVTVQRKTVCGVGLQLDGVSARLFGSVDKLDGSVKVLIMVAGHFCHAETGMAFADPFVADLKFFFHRNLRFGCRF